MRLACTMPLLLLAICCAAPAQAKSFYYPSIEVTADVQADGSMHVREARTFAFSGNYHEAWHKIPLPLGAAIADVSVSEGGQAYRQDSSGQPGTFSVIQQGGETEIHWYYDIADRTAAFTIDYDVIGAVEKHADAAQLYWKFIEPDRGVRADATRVMIALPAGVTKGDIKAFAHGPLTGKVTVADGRVTMECSPLPDGQMVEARVLFPATSIVSSRRQDASEILPSVSAEETQWAAEANRKRSRERVVIFLPVALAVGGFVLWLMLYLAYGREYQEANAPEYVREPLEGWTPNAAAYLWKQGSLGPQDMTAMLMDLVRRGALRLIVQREEHELLGGLLGTRTEDEQYIERVDGYSGEMSPAERYFLEDILFRGYGSTGRVSMDEIKEDAKSNPTSARARYEHWKSLATEESQKVPLHDPASKVAMGVGIALGAAMFGSTFLLAAALNTPMAMVPGFVGFALIPGSLAIRRRTREAATALHRWQAFRRYLTDFSRLKEYAAPAVVLWEQYLVFAVTLGVAERVIEQFKELHALMVREGQTTGIIFPNWVSYGGSQFASMDSIGSAFSSFSSSFATATSSYSSSSGGGGGFSGGGGGGGGGGSSGAR